MVKYKLELFLIVMLFGTLMLYMHLSIRNSEKDYVDGMNEFAANWCKTQIYEYIVSEGYYNEDVCVQNETYEYTAYDIRFYDIKSNQTVFTESIWFTKTTIANHTDFFASVDGKVILDETKANKELRHHIFDVIYEYYNIFDYEISIFNYSKVYCDEHLWIPHIVTENRTYDGGRYNFEYEDSELPSVIRNPNNRFVCFDESDIFVPPVGNGITYTMDWCW